MKQSLLKMSGPFKVRHRRHTKPCCPAKIRDQKRHSASVSCGQNAGHDIPEIVDAHARVVRGGHAISLAVMRCSLHRGIFGDRSRRAGGGHRTRVGSLCGCNNDPHLLAKRGRGSRKILGRTGHKRAPPTTSILSGAHGLMTIREYKGTPRGAEAVAYSRRRQQRRKLAYRRRADGRHECRGCLPEKHTCRIRTPSHLLETIPGKPACHAGCKRSGKGCRRALHRRLGIDGHGSRGRAAHARLQRLSDKRRDRSACKT